MIDLFSDKPECKELLVQCPYCAYTISESWELFEPSEVTPTKPRPKLDEFVNALYVNDRQNISLSRMYCPNEQCQQLIIKAISETNRHAHGLVVVGITSTDWPK
jgi:hypothetical protein